MKGQTSHYQRKYLNTRKDGMLKRTLFYTETEGNRTQLLIYVYTDRDIRMQDTYLLALFTEITQKQ